MSGPPKPGPVSSAISRAARASASGLAPAALGQSDFCALGEDQGFVPPRLECARLLQRLRLELFRFRVATRRSQAETERLRGEHLCVTVADPDRDFEPLAHVAEALVDGAGIDLAMPHHHAVGRRNARKVVSLRAGCGAIR